MFSILRMMGSGMVAGVATLPGLCRVRVIRSRRFSVIFTFIDTFFNNLSTYATFQISTFQPPSLAHPRLHF